MYQLQGGSLVPQHLIGINQKLISPTGGLLKPLPCAFQRLVMRMGGRLIVSDSYDSPVQLSAALGASATGQSHGQQTHGQQIPLSHEIFLLSVVLIQLVVCFTFTLSPLASNNSTCCMFLQGFFQIFYRKCIVSLIMQTAFILPVVVLFAFFRNLLLTFLIFRFIIRAQSNTTCCIIIP